MCRGSKSVSTKVDTYQGSRRDLAVWFQFEIKLIAKLPADR